MALPLDIPPANMSPGEFGVQTPSRGYADYLGTPIRPNYYGADWGGQLPPWLQQNLGQGQYHPQPGYGGPPQGQPTVDTGQAPSAGDFYGHLNALFGGGGQPSEDWQQNAAGNQPVFGGGPQYASPDWAANAASNYPSGRGGYPSGLNQNSGSWFSRLLSSLNPSNLRGEIPSNLGGMTDPAVAQQNAAYWGGINGPGLSNPSFYPGGGVAYNLNTPGGIPFNAMGTGPGDLTGYANNRAGPLSPGNYNSFFSTTATGKPPMSYTDYLSTFPPEFLGGGKGALFGGTGPAIFGGVKGQ